MEPTPQTPLLKDPLAVAESVDLDAQQARRRFLPRPFLLWLAGFYTFWVLLVTFGEHWETVKSHWQIALAMALGSYFAGSTPMGGGTVGFPVLTLLLDEPATIGRDFSFAVQSIGMVSASVFIITARRAIEWIMLRGALIGTTIGTPLGALVVVPFVPDLAVKLTFAVLWASFGIMHFARLREIIALNGLGVLSPRANFRSGLTIGFLGGATVASMTGVGVDMILYVVLILFFRADLRIAIPTSVILMAHTSLIGILTSSLLGRVEPAVFGHWIAAAPVVAVGAPFGAIMVQYFPRAITLFIVSILCIIQFIWTCARADAGVWVWIIAIAAVGLINVAYHYLYMWGASRKKRAGA